MKRFLPIFLIFTVLLCCAHMAQAEEKKAKVWVDPHRYEIVSLKPVGSEWASGFNEVILLDRETGRTWTLKSKELKQGWVLMPRKDEPE